jgi:predicted transcriptional regulator
MSRANLWINFSKIVLIAAIIFALARLNFALQNFWRVKIFSGWPRIFNFPPGIAPALAAVAYVLH